MVAMQTKLKWDTLVRCTSVANHPLNITFFSEENGSYANQIEMEYTFGVFQWPIIQLNITFFSEENGSYANQIEIVVHLVLQLANHPLNITFFSEENGSYANLTPVSIIIDSINIKCQRIAWSTTD
jgi:hypothetical protein